MSTFAQCPQCKDDRLKLQGIDYGDQVGIRKWLCKDCGYTTTVEVGKDGKINPPYVEPTPEPAAELPPEHVVTDNPDGISTDGPKTLL